MLLRNLLSAKIHDWDNGARTCTLSHQSLSTWKGLTKPIGQVSDKCMCLEPLLLFKAIRMASVPDSWFLFRTAHHGKETEEMFMILIFTLWAKHKYDEHQIATSLFITVFFFLTFQLSNGIPWVFLHFCPCPVPAVQRISGLVLTVKK